MKLCKINKEAARALILLCSQRQNGFLFCLIFCIFNFSYIYSLSSMFYCGNRFQITHQTLMAKKLFDYRRQLCIAKHLLTFQQPKGLHCMFERLIT